MPGCKDCVPQDLLYHIKQTCINIQAEILPNRSDHAQAQDSPSNPSSATTSISSKRQGSD